MKKTFLLFLFFVISFILLTHGTHTYAQELARAGGGESFGGGFGGLSGDSSFSGGFGSGSSGFFFLPFFFGGGGSFGGFIFLLIVFFLIPYFLRRYGIPGMQNMARQQQYQSPSYPEPDLTPITQDDPGFNKERFIDRVETAFFEIQKAWQQKDLSPVRGYMSDAQYQRFSRQIQDLTNRGVTNIIENMVIGAVHIIKVTKDSNYETITCAIRASNIDYTIDDKTQKVVEGNKFNPIEFEEYWTFMRSAGVKTKESDALLTKTCPNCGAPLDINEAGQCKYCKAYVTSGEFDWVLSNISQTLA